MEDVSKLFWEIETSTTTPTPTKTTLTTGTTKTEELKRTESYPIPLYTNLASKMEFKKINRQCLRSSFGELVPEPFQYRWHDPPTFPSVKLTDSVGKSILQKEKWSVTEKIDGAAICVSSDSWIASKRRVVLRYISHPCIALASEECRDGFPALSGASLSRPFHLCKKAVLLASKLNRDCPGLELDVRQHYEDLFDGEKDQILLYGTLVLSGTSTSPVDLYDYKRRFSGRGQMVVEGVGLIFASEKNVNDKLEILRRRYPSVNVNVSLDKKKTYLTWRVTERCDDLFEECKIPVARIFDKSKTISDHFNYEEISQSFSNVQRLERRRIAGLIFHSEHSTEAFLVKRAGRLTHSEREGMKILSNRDWIRQSQGHFNVYRVLDKLVESGRFYVEPSDLVLASRKLEKVGFVQTFKEELSEFVKATSTHIHTNNDAVQKYIGAAPLIQFWKMEMEVFVIYGMFFGRPMLFDKEGVFLLKLLVANIVKKCLRTVPGVSFGALDRSHLGQDSWGGSKDEIVWISNQIGNLPIPNEKGNFKIINF